MKFNSMLLIIICLLQALNSSTDGFNEQTFIDATSKIIKYAKIYHEEWMKLEDKESLYDLKMYFKNHHHIICSDKNACDNTYPDLLLLVEEG